MTTVRTNILKLYQLKTPKNSASRTDCSMWPSAAPVLPDLSFLPSLLTHKKAYSKCRGQKKSRSVTAAAQKAFMSETNFVIV